MTNLRTAEPLPLRIFTRCFYSWQLYQSVTGVGEKQKEHLQSCGVKQKVSIFCSPSQNLPFETPQPLVLLFNLLHFPFPCWHWQLCIPYFVCICGQMFIIHKVYWLLAQMILSWKHIFR